MDTENTVVEAPVDGLAGSEAQVVPSEPTPEAATQAMASVAIPPPVPQIRYEPGDEVTVAGTTYVVQRAGNWTRKEPKSLSKKERTKLRKKAGHGRA